MFLRMHHQTETISMHVCDSGARSEPAAQLRRLLSCPYTEVHRQSVVGVVYRMYRLYRIAV